MTIKLVVCDMDGTLIGKDEVIESFIPRMIHELNARDIRFIIATGRTPELSNSIISRLEIEDPCVLTNGAVIVQQSNVIVKHSFRVWPLQSLIENAVSYDMSVIFAGDKHDTVLQKTPWIVKQNQLFGRYLQEYMPMINEWELLKLSKITIWDKTHQIERITDSLFQRFSRKYAITKYDSSCVEIAPVGINKGTGIRQIAELLQIELSEIMAIGDHYNDLEMITSAGIGVAIGTAPDEVKQAANYVTEKPLAYGVLEAVNLYCQ
ncbi:HAD family hydrolase [Paenibacillus crassostreae]|uniref:Hydrolase n=1 Tax=Paenibacillus crassostreae TaxID=1763538 RepID=A0A167BEY1_9BACL|nr:HAD family hydrolase [Paenibacillus crassostreae]AOZ92901.1 hypothetical protein LPB68_12200 [Paenibacillus crassostreae]OAB72010.1 hypothetical protein PNBC_18695 [Paenibacillus crassostreae]